MIIPPARSSVPVGLTNVVAISGGYFHSLALTPQVLASLTNSLVLDITNGMPQTNNVVPGGITYYQVNVPTNADFATNSLLFTLNGSLNVWFSTNTPPSISNPGDVDLIPGSTNGYAILTTSSTPTNIVPGSIYYLGVQNTNNFAVNYGIEVDFHLVQTTVQVSGIIYTNIGGTNGFLLTWFAPSNELFQVQWRDSLIGTWQTFTNPPFVSYNPNFPASATNAQFNFFDDGSEAPFTGSRFYQVILYGSATLPNTPPVLPVQRNRVINPLNPLVVTNTAADADVPVQTLTYSLTSTVTGTNAPVINPTNGVITWTPDVTQAGTSNTITTVVTDSGVPPLSATNVFAVMVNPVPDISGLVYTNGGFLLTWLAPTNDIFQVQVATNLAPVVWQTFTNIITYTGPVTPTNGWFSFFDNNTQYPSSGPRFYQLKLIGISTPSTPGNTPPVLPVQAGRVMNPLNPLVVTNTATDADVPAQTLSYSLTSTVTGTNAPVINPTNGVITWTPDVTQAGTSNTITTVVTDNGVPPLSATNVFVVVVNPVPDISGLVYTNGGFLLTWLAPTNDIFQVQVATNLAPVVWQTFTNIITYTGPVTPTNGWFSFFDDGTQYPSSGPRFYQLKLIGVVLPATPPPATNNFSFTGGVSTNGAFRLTWSAPTNDQFQVQWTTNIAPPVFWNTFLDTITSTNGTFSFEDTNTPMLLKFYQLILLP